MKWLDRFCARNERYGIKNLITIVVAGTAIVYVAILANPDLYFWLMFNWDLILRGEVWRLLTFIFLPTETNPIFIVFVLYFYYFIGRALEHEWGRMKLTVYYFSGIILTALASIIFGSFGSASFVNLSLFLAFATLFPDYQILFFFLIPLKVKWLALLDLVYFIFIIFSNPFPNNMLPLVALANYLLFFGGHLISLVKRMTKPRTSPRPNNTVKFTDALKKSRQEKGYIHKCETCGLTDAEKPDMEFRYCSLCKGYCCYCTEHLFNHEHK